MDKAKVTQAMALFDKDGYNLWNAVGRCMRPSKVYHEILKDESHFVIITKEPGVDHRLKECLSREKQEKRKYAEVT